MLYCLDLGLVDHRLAAFPINLRCAGAIAVVRRMLRSLCRCTHEELHSQSTDCQYHIIDEWEPQLNQILQPGDEHLIQSVALCYWEVFSETRKLNHPTEEGETTCPPPFKVRINAQLLDILTHFYFAFPEFYHFVIYFIECL